MARTVIVVLALAAVGCGDWHPFRRNSVVTSGPDLVVFTPGLCISMTVTAPADPTVCAVDLGCVGGPSGRSLLQFTIVTQNLGTDTLYLGDPYTPDSWAPPYTGLFEPTVCGYNALADYAAYWLCPGTDIASCSSTSAMHAADGLMELFCLLENFGTAPDWTGTPAACGLYSCTDMGIQPGCAFEYYPGLDCQHVDVTDVAPGDYVLCAHLDPTNRFVEMSDDNNVGCVTVNLTGAPGSMGKPGAPGAAGTCTP